MKRKCTFHRLPSQEEVSNRKKAREVVIRHTAAIRGIPIDQVGDDTEIPEKALRAINEELNRNIWSTHPLTVGQLIKKFVCRS